MKCVSPRRLSETEVQCLAVHIQEDVEIDQACLFILVKTRT